MRRDSENVVSLYNTRITETDVDILRRIREAMITQTMSIAGLSEASGIPYYTLKNKFALQSRISGADIILLARSLGCSTDQLLVGMSSGDTLQDQIRDLSYEVSLLRQKLKVINTMSHVDDISVGSG